MNRGTASPNVEDIVQRVAASPQSFTLVVRHSLIVLENEAMKQRSFHPRSGFYYQVSENKSANDQD